MTTQDVLRNDPDLTPAQAAASASYEDFLRQLMAKEPVEITPDMITPELEEELKDLIALSDERVALAAAVNRHTPCPVCGGEVGHLVNCPRGIAFTGEAAEGRRITPIAPTAETAKRIDELYGR